MEWRRKHQLLKRTEGIVSYVLNLVMEKRMEQGGMTMVRIDSVLHITANGIIFKLVI